MTSCIAPVCPSPPLVSSCKWLSRAADASAVVVGGPASPLALQVSDVNKDYVFLAWQPPSADGGSPVEGYYVERRVNMNLGIVFASLANQFDRKELLINWFSRLIGSK